jgi:predicted ATPase/class 3 adenylate cyclase
VYTAKWSAASKDKALYKRAKCEDRCVTDDSVLSTGTRTLLFTDQVGSTALRTRVGDPTADALRRTHDALLRDAVLVFGGRVVKGTGDGLHVAFGSAADGVRCAIAMQQAAARFRQRARVDLRVRIGLSAGDVVWEDDDFYGMPVIEAARLEAAAQPDQILAADMVRVLAGSRSDAVFSSVGKLALKGLPEAILVCEIASELEDTTVEIPAALQVPKGSEFVDRTTELRWLETLCGRVRAGERAVVLIGGEPGIGKTRLVAELARTVHRLGARVLYGAAFTHAGARTDPLPDALSGYMSTAHLADLRLEVADDGKLLSSLVPLLTDRLADLNNPIETANGDRLFGAIDRFLSHVAEARPLMLVLDDLDRADADTLRALRHLAASNVPAALLVLGCYRDGRAGPPRPLAELVAQVDRFAHFHHRTLRSLDDAGVAVLLADCLDGAVGADVVAAVYEETGGNPQAVHRAARVLRERSVLDAEGNLEASEDALRDELRKVRETTVYDDCEFQRASSTSRHAGRPVGVDDDGAPLTIENVTVLFTDMVGSTALLSGLAVDAANELRRGHFSILRQAVAEATGTEVKSVGDGLMVVFGSASAALSCAVTMQQRVERDNHARAQSVGLRVGLSGGEVSREDDDYFGDPVVEAARFCAMCESGQVLAADIVRLTAGRRSRHKCRALGDLRLEGLPDPVSAVEVGWDPLVGPDSGTSVPLPGPLAVRPAVGVVGREIELASMVDAFKRVAADEGREVLLISGEAGLGKTTLVAETARGAFDAGACVLFGHCEEDLATPYQLFSEALGHYVTHAPEDQLVAHVASHGSELARLIPALASRIPDLPPSKATDAETERYLLFAAVVGLCAAASKNQPLMLVLDDLQWADKASLQLLRHLTASELAMRVLVLGTYRDGQLSHADALRETLGVLRRYDRVSRIELVGLDDNGVVAFMEAAAGHRLDDAAVGLAHAVYRETDGNPFFVSEVLRHLAETGAISRDATGRWMAEGSSEQVALPDSVREVIGGRVVRLGQDAERVLSMAAVIGRDFDLDLLACATSTSENELLDVLDAATAAALVRELADTPGHYNFTHALIQHTLYMDLTLTRRARAHRQVGEALEALCGDRPGARVGQLARHWSSATQPGDLVKAIGYSRQAGDAALDALAPADALHYYAQALDLYPQATDPDPILALDLAIGLGTAQRQTGDPAFRDTLLHAARRAADLDDTEHLVAAALANDRGFFSAVGTVDTDKVEVLETALARIPTDHIDRALVLANLCQELTFGSTLEERRALAEEALAIAESSGDDATIVRVLNHVSFPLLVPQLQEDSLSRSANALDRAERAGDPLLLFFAAGQRAAVAACSGDVDEQDRCLEIAGSLAEELDQPPLSWAHGIQRAKRALIAGDTDRAEALASEALQIGTDSGEPDAFAVFGLQILSASLQRGNMGDLAPIIEQATVDNPQIPGAVAALALAHIEGGRTDQARLLLEDFAATDFELVLDLTWLTTIVYYSEVAIGCRDTRYAQPLFDRLAPWADRLSHTEPTAEGPVSHYLGGLATVLGGYDEADAYFAQSAALSDRVGAKFFAARTDLSWGKLLAERSAPGDNEKAWHLLIKAHTVAAAHGYGNVERRAVAALKLLDR